MTKTLKLVSSYVLFGTLGVIFAALAPMLINFVHTLVDTVVMASTSATQGNAGAAAILVGGFAFGIFLKVLVDRS
jgi:hypothetical protein